MGLIGCCSDAFTFNLSALLIQPGIGNLIPRPRLRTSWIAQKSAINKSPAKSAFWIPKVVGVCDIRSSFWHESTLKFHVKVRNQTTFWTFPALFHVLILRVPRVPGPCGHSKTLTKEKILLVEPNSIVSTSIVMYYLLMRRASWFECFATSNCMIIQGNQCQILQRNGAVIFDDVKLKTW